MYLIFDTETTGLPKNFNAPLSDSENWPRMVQIAWQLHDDKGNLIDNQDYIIKPEDYDIPFNAVQIHGISTEIALNEGKDLAEVLTALNEVLKKSNVISGHNIMFDINIVGAEMYRKNIASTLSEIPYLDTADYGKDITKLPGGRGGQYKFPKLEELHHFLFGEKFDEAHNAAADVNATARCFFEMMRLNTFPIEKLLIDTLQFENFLKSNPSPVRSFDIVVRRQVAALKDDKNKQTSDWKTVSIGDYFHFHCHSVFSRLQSSTHFSEMIEVADQNNFPAVGVVDYGNMMGAFKFINEIEAYNQKLQSIENNTKKPLIPIIGCEVYISEKFQQKQFTKDDPDRVSHIVLLAKNLEGFQNLAKISSEGFINGFYNQTPRVSKAVIIQHKSNLIAVTGSLNSDICNSILNFGEQQAEEIFKWWHQEFGKDFYIQIQNHGLKEETYVNQVLLKWAEKYAVKTLAQNETFYTKKSDANVQDILICIKEGTQKSQPIGRGYGKRLGLSTQEYYLRNREEVQQAFANFPQCFEHYQDFLSKFEAYSLKRPVLLPKFDIPVEFIDPQDEIDGGKRGEMKYLRHLTYKGAEQKYTEITEFVRERLDFELEIISKTGYPGYFLIVQDFCNQAKKMGVSVGPGRGSAAGSAVAYCTGITNVDPIKYDLLFERFLNPERVSMPDIDIDFDDEGRGKIIDWVVDKYGQSQVAQIITYGTLGGKSAIKDAGRVLEYPLSDTTQLSNLLPATPGFNLKKAFETDEKKLKDKYKFDADIIARINKLKGYLEENSIESKVVDSAYKMEGGLRNTGIHACGVIITPEDIRNLVPVSNAKDSSLFVSQFDNSVVESAGLLKMDFLGLKTLSIIKNAVQMVKERFNINLDIDTISLEDEKTYQLFKDGKTVGIFQYESEGMQKHLRDLQPDKFEDLIAMNALYRPGPLQYIPNFIARKHGREEIVYDLPEMEEYLSDTYGITVYQEQVMLLSQKLANFTKGEADTLRKAMGKKQRAVLDKMYPKFIDGGKSNNLDEQKLNKIWKDWEAFAEYAFNKSHSTCYALIAYQTAYLKANYPAEYMAAVLNNANAIDKIAFFMEECKNIGVPVLGPDVNESGTKFTVTKDGIVRFGLSYIKGVGEKAVTNLIEERELNGFYQDIYDFSRRNAKTSVNKKAYEQFAMSGAFDSFGYARSQYFYSNDAQKLNQIERLIKYGNDYLNQKESAQFSLFGESSDMDISVPPFQEMSEWGLLEKLSHEKNTIGIFLTGHPLDLYQFEMQQFCNYQLSQINNLLNKNDFNNADESDPDQITNDESLGTEEDSTKLTIEQLIGKELFIGGIITKYTTHTTKKGDPFAVFTLSDYSGSMEFRLFKNDFTKYSGYLSEGHFIFIRGNIKKHLFRAEDWEIAISQMHFLSDLRENFIHKIAVNIPIQTIDNTFINTLDTLIAENIKRNQKTTCHLSFLIFDSEGNYIKMLTRKDKIFPDNELLEQIDSKLKLNYSVIQMSK